ncbi:MAG: polymer-forming cytoskeletal protein [Chloroflexota bacterium]
MNRRQAKRAVLLIIFIGLLLVPPSAEAFDGRQADSLVIAEDEVLTKDLYFQGGSLELNGTLQGDLFFAGDLLAFNGTIEGDLIAGGNLIEIKGSVLDDVIAGGSAVIISEGATIAGDALLGGLGVLVAEGATITGDLHVGAQNILIEGTVGQNLSGGGAGAEISGTIRGDVMFEFGPADGGMLPFDFSRLNPNLPENTPRVAPGLLIKESAVIGGDFDYNSTSTVTLPDSQIGGGITFTQNEIFTEPTLGERFSRGVWQGLQRWLVIVLLGSLLLRFAPALVEKPTDLFKASPREGVLFGAFTYFLWVPAAVLAIGLLILIGSLFGLVSLNLIAAIVIIVGVLLIIIDVVFIILTLTFVNYLWVGRLIGNLMISDAKQQLLPLAAGTFVVVLLARMPFVGWIVRPAVGIIGLGMLWVWWRSRSYLKPAG